MLTAHTLLLVHGPSLRRDVGRYGLHATPGQTAQLTNPAAVVATGMALSLEHFNADLLRVYWFDTLAAAPPFTPRLKYIPLTSAPDDATVITRTITPLLMSPTCGDVLVIGDHPMLYAAAALAQEQARQVYWGYVAPAQESDTAPDDMLQVSDQRVSLPLHELIAGFTADATTDVGASPRSPVPSEDHARTSPPTPDTVWPGVLDDPFARTAAHGAAMDGTLAHTPLRSRAETGDTVDDDFFADPFSPPPRGAPASVDLDAFARGYARDLTAVLREDWMIGREPGNKVVDGGLLKQWADLIGRRLHDTEKRNLRRGLRMACALLDGPSPSTPHRRSPPMTTPDVTTS